MYIYRFIDFILTLLEHTIKIKTLIRLVTVYNFETKKMNFEKSICVPHINGRIIERFYFSLST